MSASYCEHIVPVLHTYLDRMRLVFMQDNAPGHGAKATQDDLRARSITPIFWPVLSPDLNPIETLWDKIKDYIDAKYPEIHRSYA